MADSIEKQQEVGGGSGGRGSGEGKRWEGGGDSGGDSEWQTVSENSKRPPPIMGIIINQISIRT